MDQKNNKRSDLINLFLGLVLIVLLNVASQFLFTRFDLTSEKRYTLAQSTKKMLKDLDDIVYFQVYLEGDFPQGAGDYKRLRDETRIMLDEFRAYGGDKIQYEFIDPTENPDKKAQLAFEKQLYEKGLTPVQVAFTGDDGSEVRRWLFPWAVATYKEKRINIPLFGSNSGKVENAVNNAVEGLEYELCNGIRKLEMTKKPRIAITQGHGEADTLELADLAKSLREYYDVDYVTIHNNLNALRDTMQDATQIHNKYDAVIVDGPDSVFSPAELFILDQFVMYGGKAMFLVDPVYLDMDTFALTGKTAANYREIGLEDLIFRYGARLNGDLVEDLNCAPVPITVPGPQPRIDFFPWYFSPTILPREQHPIVRNLDPIKFDFLSTVDTVETQPGIKKTILIRSSERSRYVRTPAPIVLQMAMYDRPPSTFNKPNLPVAVLLEGKFESYYKNKFLPDDLKNSKLIGYQKQSIDSSKIIVVGDGDVARNPVYKGKPIPLGYDLLNPRNQQIYANKTFLVNCMNYLFDDQGLLSLRSREVTLRILNKAKIKEHRLKWQLINTLTPMAMVVLLGFILMWRRRKRYGDGQGKLFSDMRNAAVVLSILAIAIAAGSIVFALHFGIVVSVAVAIAVSVLGILTQRARQNKTTNEPES